MLIPRLAVLGAAVLLLSACGSNGAPATTTPRSAATAAATAAASSTPAALTNAPMPVRGSGTVLVSYAGSLVSLMENTLGPAFDKATGYQFQGEGKGSVALANEIKDKLRQPDVFISADATVNNSLAGAQNGDLADWYVVWGHTSLVIAYSPKSKFAPQLEQAKAGTTPWYTVVEQPGFKLGRTDPEVDPKGYNTLFMLGLAVQYYHQPGLKRTIVDESKDQVFPEEELISRMQSGQLDAGVFYLSEVAGPKLPYITLPDEINLSNPSMTKLYGEQTYTNAKGQTFRGAPILYTATVPSVAKNPAGGVAFIQYLATADAREVMQANGILPSNLLAGNDASRIPAQLQPYVKGSYAP